MLTTKPYLRTRRPSPTTAEFIVSTRPSLTLPLRILLGLVYVARFLAALGVLLFLFSAWSLNGPYSSSPPPSSLSSLPAVTTTTTTDITTTLIAIGDNADTNTNNDTTAAIFQPSSPSPPPSQSLFPPSPISTTTTVSLATLHTLLLHIQTQTQPGRLATSLALALPPSFLLAGAIPFSLILLYILLLGRIHTEERLLVLRGLGIQIRSSSSGTLLPSGATTTRFIPTGKIRDVLIAEAFRGFEVRHYLAVVVDGEEDVVVVFPTLLPRPRVLEKVWRGVRGCLWEFEMIGEGGRGDGGRVKRNTRRADGRADEDGFRDVKEGWLGR